MVENSGVALPRPGAFPGLGLQALSYLGVSVIALGCDTGAYMLLAGILDSTALAAGAGYVLGLLVHFALSRLFVFDAAATAKGQLRLFLEFATSGLVGLGLTMAVIALAVDIIGIALLPAKVAAVAVSFVAVFLIRRFVVFAAMPK